MIWCKQLHCREELGMHLMEVNKQMQWPVGMYESKNHLNKASKQGQYKPIRKQSMYSTLCDEEYFKGNFQDLPAAHVLPWLGTWRLFRELARPGLLWPPRQEQGRNLSAEPLLHSPTLRVQVVEIPFVPQKMVLALVSEWDRVDAIMLVWYLGWPTHLIPHCLPWELRTADWIPFKLGSATIGECET